MISGSEFAKFAADHGVQESGECRHCGSKGGRQTRGKPSRCSECNGTFPFGKEEDAGTATANMPFGKLIAPADKGKRREEILGMVVRQFPEAVDVPTGPEPENLLGVPAIRQTTNFCGPAALLSVLQFFGISTTEQEVAKASGGSHARGVTAEGLVAAAKSFGFDAEYVTGGTSAEVVRRVGQDRIPILVFWFGHGRRGDGPHASVACGYDQQNVWLMDPEVGMSVPKLWVKFLGSWFSFASDTPSPDGLRVGEHLIVRP